MKCIVSKVSGPLPHLVSAGRDTYMTYRADEMMARAGRFVDGLKAAGVEPFAGRGRPLGKGYLK